MADNVKYRVTRSSGGDPTDEYTGTESEAIAWAQQQADERGWDDWQLQANDGGDWYDVAVPEEQRQTPPAG